MKFTGNCRLTCPRWDSNLDSGERQLAVSGSALDHVAVRTGPKVYCINLLGELEQSIQIQRGDQIRAPVERGTEWTVLTPIEFHRAQLLYEG